MAKLRMPEYKTVGGDLVVETGKDIELLNNFKNYYVFDRNVYVDMYHDSIHITDLTNAMKIGKTCAKIKVAYYRASGSSMDLASWMVGAGYTTLEQLIDGIEDIVAAFKADADIQKWSSKSELESANTFSPFVEVKPIKTPKKWTIANLRKALLSGQIDEVMQEYHYTDDYAYDADVNYGKGEQIDKADLARELYEKGTKDWLISVKDDGRLSLSQYSFRSMSFEFREA